MEGGDETLSLPPGPHPLKLANECGGTGGGENKTNKSRKFGLSGGQGTPSGADLGPGAVALLLGFTLGSIEYGGDPEWSAGGRALWSSLGTVHVVFLLIVRAMLVVLSAQSRQRYRFQLSFSFELTFLVCEC